MNPVERARIAPSKGSTRLGVFLYLRMEAQPPSETQYYIDRQWTKSKERSLQLDSILVFIDKYISAKKQDLHYFSREVVTVHVCTYIFEINCIQHAKPPLRMPYSQNPNPISDTSVSYDDINGSTI